MSDESEYGLGAVLLEDGGSLDESAASVGHIIDKDGDLVLDITDENLLSHSQLSALPKHHFRLSYHTTNNVGAGALLMDKSEAGVEVVCDGGST